MQDPKKNQQQTKELEDLKKLHEKTLEDLNLKGNGYKCYSCGNNVNYIFIMQFIKDSGLCPDCWHEET